MRRELLKDADNQQAESLFESGLKEAGSDGQFSPKENFGKKKRVGQEGEPTRKHSGVSGAKKV
jgi:hypothetical protein